MPRALGPREADVFGRFMVALFLSDFFRTMTRAPRFNIFNLQGDFARVSPILKQEVLFGSTKVNFKSSWTFGGEFLPLIYIPPGCLSVLRSPPAGKQGAQQLLGPSGFALGAASSADAARALPTSYCEQLGGGTSECPAVCNGQRTALTCIMLQGKGDEKMKEGLERESFTAQDCLKTWHCLMHLLSKAFSGACFQLYAVMPLGEPWWPQRCSALQRYSLLAGRAGWHLGHLYLIMRVPEQGVWG